MNNLLGEAWIKPVPKLREALKRTASFRIRPLEHGSSRGGENLLDHPFRNRRAIPERLEGSAFVLGTKVMHLRHEQIVRATTHIELEIGQDVSGDALRARVKQELSAYKVPRHIVIYGAGALPFTDTGKIDKRRLADDLAARIADA